MKSLLYLFRRYRLTTLLNLFGLGVAVATFYLFMTQVIYNRTYNYNIKDHDRTFRLEVKTALFDNKWGCHTCRPYEEIIKEIPHVEQTVNMAFNRQTNVTVGENTINVLYIGMSKPGVEFFCGKLLYGSSKTWDYGATAIVNRSTAGKLFGTDKAVGKTFTLKENGVDKPITIVGVSEDMPDNCTIGNGLYMCENPKDAGDASEWSFNIFVRLDNPANKAAVERAFKKEEIKNTFGEFLAAHHMTQARIAETEKYAHVTFFFNGGVEEPNEGEDRILVPSPKEVPTYDLKPEMSAPIVCDKLVEAIESGKYDVIIINFANPDMVGHTGVESAAIKAIETVDACVGRAVEAIKAAGGVLFICADHGNAEVMVDEATGEPWTAHTTNQVPFILVGADPAYKLREGGRLCDIVPTLIELMGLEKPKEMTGESLLVK